MSRPLSKHKLDGTPYFRRDKVEAEIQALAGASEAELERRAALYPFEVESHQENTQDRAIEKGAQDIDGLHQGPQAAGIFGEGDGETAPTKGRKPAHPDFFFSAAATK